ncbi:AraC family transcriptional regulator [Rheinheimera sp.]|uniref:AraC family transcriptional regulator n=1 Tax=Rheinheimera sp. TaxID=1869214 RepID=UPI00262CAEDB|nr:AraC family transcriptional regulator [Rheinheimera sp.]MCA1931006.1 AraC family transcriptional regulator [Rheinheimera sp.]
MKDALLNTVRRYVEAYANPNGLAQTPILGLTTIRSNSPSGLEYAISRPLVCLVLQGKKQVVMGSDVFDFSAGDSLLISADVPTISQITQASPDAPYISLVLDLDLSVIAELTEQMVQPRQSSQDPVQVQPTDQLVADAALRLMNLLDRPESVPILHKQLVREMHYWLLAGRHGAAIQRLGYQDSHVRQIAKAVAVLRTEFRQPLQMEQLAALAGMSPSSFYQHFRSVTSLSPLQFQKQLRLIEARRLMRAEGLKAGSAAFAVGYESVPQFSREYRRFFGLTPLQDKEQGKASAIQTGTTSTSTSN